MWHLIKSELSAQRATWLGFCIFLTLTMPILLLLDTGSLNEKGLKVMANLSKGFVIMLTCVALSTMLANLAPPRLPLHLRLPIPILHLGIVRLSNTLSPLFCVFVLLLVNFSLFPPQLQNKAINATLWAMPFVFITSSLMLITVDLMQHNKRITPEQSLVFILLIPISVFLTFYQYQESLFNFSRLHLSLFYFFSFILLGSSTCTFVRQRT